MTSGLQAFGSADLPKPPPFTPRHVFRTIGPGVIGLGVAIGSGEWLLGPSVIASYGPHLLWLTTVAVVLQVLLNLEMARYTLYTGEPIITGFMRTWPGSTFWGITYALLSLLQYGWPGWALASATASAALILGRMPGAGDAGLVVMLGYATFGLCLIITLTGRKIERTLEIAMWTMVAAVLVYLLGMSVASVSGATWKLTAISFFSIGDIPAGADWTLLAAFAAYSGSGGIGNAFITNWMRDKGFGMGGTVGYIPGAAGSMIRLKPHGNVFPVTPDSLRDWKGWWKHVYVDQCLIFGLGSFVGMALTALLTLEYVKPGATIGGWAAANMLAGAIAAVHGPVFWWLTIFCGFWVLFSTQLGVVDGLPRAITDIVWSASPRARRIRGGDVRAVYYGVVALFVLWGGIALSLAQPLTLILIGANVAGFIFVLESIHTLIVNRTLLPKALRPPLWRELSLVATAIFYGALLIAVLVRLVW
ncbi:MAG: Nramp family divalent metal transporter [Vicinamibacterales bacterium]